MWYDNPLSIERREVEHVSNLALGEIEHPDARAILDMWETLRGDRPVPFRAELDAQKVGARAPFLAILEQVEPSNFRIRIAGDRLNRWFGMELRGMSALSLLETSARNHFQATLNRIALEPAAGLVDGVARTGDGLAIRFEMLLLPMRSDFGRVDRVLVGLWLLDGAALTRGPMRLDPARMSVASIVSDSAEAPLARADAAMETAPIDRPMAPTLHAIEGTSTPVGQPGDGPRPYLRLVKKP